ncbi:MAG: PAS domain S-box protein [Acidobacteria bacterium]|nr:PAS domain S-box protein [Acidobacteriota bacterium]
MRPGHLAGEEAARLRALRETALLDTPPEPEFDDLARLAAQLTGTSMALITLIDSERSWFKARIGFSATEAPRDESFCGWALSGEAAFLEIQDTRADGRFAESPMVLGPPHVRFYAGARITSPAGFVLGALCVLDGAPRSLTPEVRDGLIVLARQVSREIELRRRLVELEKRKEQLAAYESIVETGQGLIFTHDLEGRVLTLNAATADSLGIPRQHAVGRSIFEFLDADRRPAAQAYLEQVRTTSFAQGQVRVRAQRGEERTWVYRNTLYEPNDGPPVVIVHAHDITERKRAESSLAERVRLAQFTADVATSLSSKEPIEAIATMCAEAVVAYLWGSFATVWLLDGETHELVLVGSAGQSRVPEPRSRIRVGQFFTGRVAESGRSLVVPLGEEGERPVDGSWASAAGMTAFAGFPLLLSGRVVGVLGMYSGRPLSVATLDALAQAAQHIALGLDRRRSLESLAENEARTRALIDRMRVGLVVFDVEGIVESANPAAALLFGSTVDALRGRPLEHYLPGVGTPQRGLLAEQLHGDGHSRALEWKGRRGNGTFGPLDVSAHPFPTVHGLRYAAILQDASRRHELDRLKREFVAAVSHELRTPLTSVRGALRLLLAGAVGPLSADGMDLVTRAERNTRRLLDLINDLLDLERLQSGTFDVSRRELPLTAVLERSLDVVRGIAEPQEVTIRIGEASGRVLGDEDRLVQVVVNLLSNAVKFSPRGSEVIVSATEEGAEVEVRVVDQGRGVPTEARDLIFERFRQVESSDARRQGGTGLGLAISKAIVDAHGGRIGIADDTSSGSTFWFRIPRAITGTKLRRPRVVVLDDEPELRHFLEKALRKGGYEPVLCETSGEALEAMKRDDVSAAVLDVVLPGESGLALLSRVRMDPQLARVGVVLMSGLAGPPDEADAFPDATFLPKPFDVHQLLGALQEAVQRGRP